MKSWAHSCSQFADLPDTYCKWSKLENPNGFRFAQSNDNWGMAKGTGRDEVSPKWKSAKVFIKPSLVFNTEIAKWVVHFAVWKAALAVFLWKSCLALGVGSLQSRDVLVALKGNSSSYHMFSEKNGQSQPTGTGLSVRQWPAVEVWVEKRRMNINTQGGGWATQSLVGCFNGRIQKSQNLESLAMWMMDLQEIGSLVFLRCLPVSAASLAFAFTTHLLCNRWDLLVPLGPFAACPAPWPHIATGASQGDLWFPTSHTRQARLLSWVVFAAPKPGLVSPPKATFPCCALGLRSLPITQVHASGLSLPMWSIRAHSSASQTKTSE